MTIALRQKSLRIQHASYFWVSKHLPGPTTFNMLGMGGGDSQGRPCHLTKDYSNVFGAPFGDDDESELFYYGSMYIG